MAGKKRITVGHALLALDMAADFLNKKGQVTLGDELREIKFLVDPSLVERPEPIKARAGQKLQCPGCGTAVEKVGDICPVCAQKPQFQAPKARIEVGAQPDPVYKDGGPPVPTVR